jgi:hypothetical protein
LKRCLKQIVPFLNRNDIRESFSFQRAKKTPTNFCLPEQVFPVGATDKLLDFAFTSQPLFLFFFEEQFPVRFATRFTACFVSNKAGHHTHLSLFGNPFFKLFLKNNFLPKLTRFAARFVSNKAGHHTHLSLSCNPFFKLFSEQFIIRFSPALAACFVSNKAVHHTHFRLSCNPFFNYFSEQFLARFGGLFSSFLCRTRRLNIRTKKNRATPF